MVLQPSFSPGCSETISEGQSVGCEITNQFTPIPQEEICDNGVDDDGDDLLTGGPGADKFKCGKGTDKVTDFNEDEGDKVQKSCEIFGPF